MWFMFCSGWLQSQAASTASPHFTILFFVLPTPVLARFRVHHSFLFNCVPFGSFSLGLGIVGWFMVACSRLFHRSSWCFLGVPFKGKLMVVRKLFLDLSRERAGVWAYSGCRESVSCFLFSFFVVISLRTVD